MLSLLSISPFPPPARGPLDLALCRCVSDVRDPGKAQPWIRPRAPSLAASKVRHAGRQ